MVGFILSLLTNRKVIGLVSFLVVVGGIVATVLFYREKYNHCHNEYVNLKQRYSSLLTSYNTVAQNYESVSQAEIYYKNSYENILQENIKQQQEYTKRLQKYNQEITKLHRKYNEYKSLEEYLSQTPQDNNQECQMLKTGLYNWAVLEKELVNENGRNNKSN